MEDLKYIQNIILKYKTKQIVAICCLIVSSFFTFLLPYAMMRIIDNMAGLSEIRIIILYVLIY